MAMGVSPTVTIPGGVHTLTLTVSDGKGGTAADTVTITIRALLLTPTSLNFVLPQGADPASQSFAVQALGGTIPYSIARTASWLNSSPGDGQSSGEQDALQAIVDPGNLDPGTYTGRLVVNGPG
jgi:PKD repeat protein